MSDQACPQCGRRPLSPRPTTTSSMGTPQRGSAPKSEELRSLLGSLQADLKLLCDHTPPKPYMAVKAVFLNWENCNLNPGVRNETIELQTVLRDTYKFDAGNEGDIFRIPDRLPDQELSNYMSTQILNFAKQDAGSGRKLMIVYYNGHGLDYGRNSGLFISGYKVHLDF